MTSKTKTSAKKEEATHTLVPRLRFPEFQKSEGWKSKKLGDLFSDRQESGRTGLPLLSLMDKEGIVPQEDSNRKNNSNSDKSKYLRVVPGDIAYNTMRMWEGRSALVGLEGLVSPAYTVCEPQTGVHSLLFSYYFKTPQLIEQFRRYSQGLVKDTLNLKYAAFSRISAPIPNFPEQRKIAECLSSVDELIAAEAGKLDALKTHKKGLMQQLFPREGETQPRLRFPEFQNAGEWKQISFGKLGLDVSDGNYSSKYPRQSDFIEKGVPFLRANNLRFGTVSDAEMRFISIEQHRQITKGHLKKGDILITTRGELGVTALVPDRHIGSNINAQIVRINAGKKLANTFLFQLLDYSRTIGLFDALSTGTALKQLPIGKLNQLSLQIPDLSTEQQRIADCLASLDDLIAAQTQKLDALKTHKKGLMQQLFPSPEEVVV